MKNFGKRLKVLRLNRGYTQAQLAVELGISASAVGMYEQEHRIPGWDMLVKISRLFSVSTDYLLGAQPAPENVEEILMQIRSSLNSAVGLTFNGVPLGRDDTQKLFDAMLFAANVLLNEKARRENGADHEEAYTEGDICNVADGH